jgi:hypothetical protein
LHLCRKSGRATYGLDWFYNGSASRPERGLEWSVIAVISPDAAALPPKPQTKARITTAQL